MVLAAGYAAICIICVYVMGRQSGHAPTVARFRWCIAIASAYAVLCLVLWLQVVPDTPALVGTLAFAVVAAFVAGVIHRPAAGSPTNKTFWRAVARGRRTITNTIERLTP